MKVPRIRKAPPKKHIGLTKKLNMPNVHNGLHCVYWAHATLSEWSWLTPIYAGLFVLTLSMHDWTGKKKENVDDATH